MPELADPKNPTSAVLIVNGRSRRGREWFPLVSEVLEKSHLKLHESLLIRDPQEIGPKVKKAIKDEYPLIIIGGGDGTFSNTVRYFVKSKSVLGVLPLGTGNAFARDLGINADVTEACSVLTDGKIAGVDLGIVKDDYFLNVVTVGLTTLIAQNLTVQSKRRLGRAVYLFALLRSLATVKPFHVKVETDQGTSEFDSLQVVIGNGRFHAGPFLLAPDASITEGRLSLYALMGTRKSQLLRLALHSRGGHHVDLADVFHVEAKEGKLSTVPERKVIVDGELQFKTPITFGVAHEALRVMVPQAFTG